MKVHWERRGRHPAETRQGNFELKSFGIILISRKQKQFLQGVVAVLVMHVRMQGERRRGRQSTVGNQLEEGVGQIYHNHEVST